MFLFLLAWTVQLDTDPMTDRQIGMIYTESADATFALRCDGDRAYFALATDEFLGSGGNRGWRGVTYRIDGQEPVAARAQYDASLARLAYDYNERLAGSLANASRLRIRAVRYDDGYVDTEFDVSGFVDAVRQISHTCDQ